MKLITVWPDEMTMLRTEMGNLYETILSKDLVANSYLPRYEELSELISQKIKNESEEFVSPVLLRKLFYYELGDKSATFNKEFLDACYRFISDGECNRVEYLGSDVQAHQSSVSYPLDKDRQSKEAHIRKRPIKAVILSVLAVFALTVWGGSSIWMRNEAQGPIFDAIAVMPFEYLSSSPDREYLADGMTDALISRLGQIDNIKVIARTSVMQYKGEVKAPAEIGNELGVSALVEASVFSTEDSLKVTISLVEVARGSVVWTNSFTRSHREVLALQNQAAYMIAEKIQVEMSLEEENTLMESQEVDPEAYRLYRLGYFYFDKSKWKEAERYFEKTVKQDPKFAGGYAGLAHAKFQQVFESGHLGVEVRVLAERALSIDKNQPQALIILGLYENFQHWDWDEAERIYKKVLETNPNNREAYLELAYLYSRTNRLDSAVEAARNAYELDPRLRRTQETLVTSYGSNGMYEEALGIIQQWLAMDPEDVIAYHYWGIIAAGVGEVDAAYQAFRKATELTGRMSVSASAFYRKQGYTELYEEKHAKIQQDASSSTKALFYSANGDIEQGLYWLEKDIEENEFRRFSLNWYYKNLKDEPRYRTLLKEANLEKFYY